jgi:tetratricopeptide (TPR) repeat protein
MRIGEILVASTLIDAAKLEAALDYASTKSIPVGRALRALKYISEGDLSRGLDTQQAIWRGMDKDLAISVLRYACETNRSFPASLRKLPEQVRSSRIPPGLLEFFGKGSDMDETQTRRKPELPPATARPAEKYIMQGDQFLEANQIELAETAYDRARKTLAEAYEPDPHKQAIVFTKLANLYVATERFADAEPLYRQVVELHEKMSGRNSLQVARALEDLGDLFDIQKLPAQARPVYEGALDVLENVRPAESTVVGRLLKKVASVCTGDQSSSRVRIGELAVDAKLLTEDQVQTALKTSQDTGRPLGVVLRHDGVLTALQVEALMFAQLLIKETTMPAAILARAIKLASALEVSLRELCESGKWVSEAKASDTLYQQVVLEQERLITTEGILGADNPEVATIAVHLAEIHLQRGDKLSAEMLYRRVLNIFRRNTPKDHTQISRICEKVAQMQCQQSRYGEALPLLLESLEARRAAGQANSIEFAKCSWLVAKVQMVETDFQGAATHLSEARRIFDQVAPGTAPKQLLVDIEACAAHAAAAK